MGAAITSPAELRAGAILTVGLGAVLSNFRLLRDRVPECGAVLKADAYGLGAASIGPALLRAGCRHFFVAHLEEGVRLRATLGAGPSIYVMHGLFPGTEAEAGSNALIPVLNSLEQAACWGRRGPAVLQVDTGMARFGLSPSELDALPPLDLRFVMSHLACADQPAHPANATQLAAFQSIRQRLPDLPGSLAASSGIFLPPDWHGDLVRPGAALYGIAPIDGHPNPLRPAVALHAKVVQLRGVPAGTPVGYGHSARTTGPSRLATIAVGYADGFLRSASNRGAAWWDGHDLPILGRVSMDSIVLDASAAPGLQAGAMVELIGPNRTLDAVGATAGTIGYEVLTSLGQRYHRRYANEEATG